MLLLTLSLKHKGVVKSSGEEKYYPSYYNSLVYKRLDSPLLPFPQPHPQSDSQRVFAVEGLQIPIFPKGPAELVVAQAQVRILLSLRIPAPTSLAHTPG